MCVFNMTKKNYCLSALFSSDCCVRVPNFNRNKKPTFKKQENTAAIQLAPTKPNHNSQLHFCLKITLWQKSLPTTNNPLVTPQYTDVRSCCSVTMYVIMLHLQQLQHDTNSAT